MRYLLVGILALSCAGCGADREAAPAGKITGPGGVTVGMTVAEAEKQCGWKPEAIEALADGGEARQYRDYHWTLASGLLHGAQHHTFFFTKGMLTGWGTR